MTKILQHSAKLGLGLGIVFLGLATGIGCSPEGGHGDGENPGGGGAPSELDDTKAFVTDGPRSSVMAPCIRARTTGESCSLTELPLLSMEVDVPEIDDIMERLVVSHDWMGARFGEALALLPLEILDLMGAVTAIVIDDEIRPSYYSSRTGAIHLDPARLWLTNEEKATVSTEPDYRSDFGAELGFLSLARYVLNDAYAYPFHPLDGTEEREIGDILYRLAALLLHELAHANDYFPPSIIADLDPNQSVAQAADTWKPERVSERLTADSPLTSEMLFGLAEVMFRGRAASDSQRALSAAEVGADFAPDVGNASYSYTSQWEDVAMLFEEAMMKYLFDIDRDIAFTPVPADPAGCSDYIVEWGSRNRVGDAEVIARAEFVVTEMLPGLDFSLFFEGLPFPTPMQTGLDWCSNLQLGVQAQSLRAFPADRVELWNERVRMDVGQPHR